MDYYRCGLCHFHPRESKVGVCAACLTERLLVLAARQSNGGPFKPKIFAMGTSLLHRFDSRRRIGENDSSAALSVHSADESFISIMFEDNGQVCWDKKAAAEKVSGGKRGGARWRKRVLHLFHIVDWRRTHSKARK